MTKQHPSTALCLLCRNRPGFPPSGYSVRAEAAPGSLQSSEWAWQWRGLLMDLQVRKSWRLIRMHSGPHGKWKNHKYSWRFQCYAQIPKKRRGNSGNWLTIRYCNLKKEISGRWLDTTISRIIFFQNRKWNGSGLTADA